MAVRKTLTVWCDADDCLSWEDGGGGLTMTAARKHVQTVHGWARVKSAGVWMDLCPRCR